MPYRGKAAARRVRRKRTDDAFDFREDRPIELGVAEADCSEPVDHEQIDEVAARRCAAEERAEFVNLNLLAGRHLVGRLGRDSGSASSDNGDVDGHDLVDSSRPKPLAYVGVD
eukprot:5253899-Pleurochrysis_carterae.AAC.1